LFGHDCLECVQKIKDIMASVTIPVMAKCRIGHFAEAQILESLGVDMVDESEGAISITCSHLQLLPQALYTRLTQ
jgi:pyridoxal biosynthesis lyase PdxS